MKNITLLFLAIGLLFSSACKDDDPVAGQLSYDKDNVTGPLLDARSWVTAARFPSSQTSAFNGLQLTEVEVFFGNLPDDADILIYGAGTGNTPALPALYSADITSSLRANGWTTHRLTTPINITGQELWIGVGFLHNNPQQSIGCDIGPANANGDWTWDSVSQEWSTFRERTAEDINWNIRGIVE